MPEDKNTKAEILQPLPEVNPSVKASPVPVYGLSQLQGKEVRILQQTLIGKDTEMLGDNIPCA